MIGAVLKADEVRPQNNGQARYQVGILTFMSRINFTPSQVDYEKNNIAARPDFVCI